MPSRTKDRFGFAGDVFSHTDPTQPIGDVKEAGAMAKMAAKYGHFGIDDMRGAVEAISQNGTEIEIGYPQFSPQSDAQNGGQRAN